MLGETLECRYAVRMGESVDLPPKKDVMLALLEGASVYVHMDPRRDGVVVPKWLTNQPQLVLQVGLNMAVRIPDLDVGDDGVSCTLSFNRSPFWCFMPWTAIYGLVGEDGRGMIWPEDVPLELAQGGQPARTRPRLEAVRDEPNEPAREAATEEAPVQAPKVAPKKPRIRAAAKPKEAKAEDAPAPPAAESPRPSKPTTSPSKSPAPVPAAARTSDDSEIHEEPEVPAPTGKRPLPPYLRVVK